MVAHDVKNFDRMYKMNRISEWNRVSGSVKLILLVILPGKDAQTAYYELFTATGEQKPV
jgi:hypothetical protein